jgi:hypothetical protein
MAYRIADKEDWKMKVEEITNERLRILSLSREQAAEYEAAKSPAPVAVAGEAIHGLPAVPTVCVCLDCGKAHEGSCVNTSEAKEKPVLCACNGGYNPNCNVHHENGTRTPKPTPPAKPEQSEPWNTTLSHFLQLDQIRRKHDALEAVVREIRKEREELKR